MSKERRTWKVSNKYIEENGVVDENGFVIADIPLCQVNENTPPNKHWASSEKYHKTISKEEQEDIAHCMAASKDMRDILIHLYVNYHLPYGIMDIETKKRFKEVIEKATGKSIDEVLSE